MGIFVRAVDTDALEGQWEIIHRQNEKSLWQNHPPALTLGALTTHRKRACTETVHNTIEKMQNARTNPNETLAMLQNKDAENDKECLHIRQVLISIFCSILALLTFT